MRSMAGTHLIVDGYVLDPTIFNDTSIFALFRTLIDTLDMTVLVPPSSCEVPVDETKLDSSDDEGGTSYWCQITTSHIALHAWPLRKAFMMDIFSCKPFPPTDAFEFIKGFLQTTTCAKYVVTRIDPLKDQVPVFQFETC